VGYGEKWKVLEDLTIELGRNGFETPTSLISDLRSAKMMITLSESTDTKGDAITKLEEIMGIVESELISEALAVFSVNTVDQWLKRLDEAMLATCETEKGQDENKLITGVPRDQKWVRVEPNGNLTTERIKQIAAENQLAVKSQKDNRIVVFGQQNGLRQFLKKMTAEATAKK